MFPIYVSIVAPEGEAGDTAVSPAVVLTQGRQFCHQESHGRHRWKYLVLVPVLLFNPLRVNPSVHLPSCFEKQGDQYLTITTMTHTVATPVRCLNSTVQTQARSQSVTIRSVITTNSHLYSQW